MFRLCFINELHFLNLKKKTKNHKTNSKSRLHPFSDTKEIKITMKPTKRWNWSVRLSSFVRKVHIPETHSSEHLLYGSFIGSSQRQKVFVLGYNKSRMLICGKLLSWRKAAYWLALRITVCYVSCMVYIHLPMNCTSHSELYPPSSITN